MIGGTSCVAPTGGADVGADSDCLPLGNLLLSTGSDGRSIHDQRGVDKMPLMSELYESKAARNSGVWASAAA